MIETAGTDLVVIRVASHEDFLRFRAVQEGDRRHREALERSLLRSGDEFELAGECFVCGQPSHFRVGYEFAAAVDGVRIPNWREVLHCRGCRLNNRMRAALHFLAGLVAPGPETALYLTEQTGALYEHLRRRFPGLVGSEYVPPDAEPTPSAANLRHEDLRALSFAAESFDAVLTFDVLEHVSDHRAALRELHRVLRPGGRMLFSVPFRPDGATNLRRALEEDDGTITHLLPPEYHGDPLRNAGCLAFHHFGWELLDELRGTGFAEVAAHFYWSRQFAYLGPYQRLFLAVK